MRKQIVKQRYYLKSSNLFIEAKTHKKDMTKFFKKPFKRKISI